MTKRFTVDDKWIKDNCIGALLNIDFNTITDANLCCDLLNQIEKEKRNNGKLASKLLNENEQLKQNIGIILKYCREKGKYAMDMKETKAHNILQRIVNELNGDDGND